MAIELNRKVSRTPLLFSMCLNCIALIQFYTILTLPCLSVFRPGQAYGNVTPQFNVGVEAYTPINPTYPMQIGSPIAYSQAGPLSRFSMVSFLLSPVHVQISTF